MINASVWSSLGGGVIARWQPPPAAGLRSWHDDAPGRPGSEVTNRCCPTPALARGVAQLGIPFYAVDAQDVFRENVVQYFIDGYAQESHQSLPGLHRHIAGNSCSTGHALAQRQWPQAITRLSREGQGRSNC
jgi:hypothetical protein